MSEYERRSPVSALRRGARRTVPPGGPAPAQRTNLLWYWCPAEISMYGAHAKIAPLFSVFFKICLAGGPTVAPRP